MLGYKGLPGLVLPTCPPKDLLPRSSQTRVPVAGRSLAGVATVLTAPLMSTWGFLLLYHWFPRFSGVGSKLDLLAAGHKAGSRPFAFYQCLLNSAHPLPDSTKILRGINHRGINIFQTTKYDACKNMLA